MGTIIRLQNQLLNESDQLVDIPAGADFMAVVRVGLDFAVARAPEVFRFGIEPDHPAAAIPHGAQNRVLRIHIIGSSVADNNKRRFFVSNSI